MNISDIRTEIIKYIDYNNIYNVYHINKLFRITIDDNINNLAEQYNIILTDNTFKSLYLFLQIRYYIGDYQKYFDISENTRICLQKGDYDEFLRYYSSNKSLDNRYIIKYAIKSKQATFIKFIVEKYTHRIKNANEFVYDIALETGYLEIYTDGELIELCRDIDILHPVNLNQIICIYDINILQRSYNYYEDDIYEYIIKKLNKDWIKHLFYKSILANNTIIQNILIKDYDVDTSNAILWATNLQTLEKYKDCYVDRTCFKIDYNHNYLIPKLLEYLTQSMTQIEKYKYYAICACDCIYDDNLELYSYITSLYPVIYKHEKSCNVCYRAYEKKYFQPYMKQRSLY
jgi:hypothetical protein